MTTVGKPRARCVHCKTKPVHLMKTSRGLRLEGRGLCQTCYHTKEIRNSYAYTRAKPGQDRVYGDKCRHCNAKPPYPGKKGLCGSCWGRYGDQYESLSKYGTGPKQGEEEGVEAPLPQHPTRHRPGSPGKILVMAERVAKGEQAQHPDDAL